MRCNKNGISIDCGAMYDQVNHSQYGRTGVLEGRIGIVDRFGCGTVTGRGRDRGRGAVRYKSGKDNKSWGKGNSHSVKR